MSLQGKLLYYFRLWWILAFPSTHGYVFVDWICHCFLSDRIGRVLYRMYFMTMYYNNTSEEIYLNRMSLYSSSNKDNPDSNFVSLQINITAVAQVEIRG